MENVIAVEQKHWQSKLNSRGFKVVLGVSLLFAASKIYLPLNPVPVTLQSVAVLLIGLTYTPRAAFESIATWLGLAALGLPVLASNGAGLTVLLGPTGGYLCGFLVTAPLMALVVQQQTNFHRGWRLLCSSLVGSGIIMLCGVAWITKFMGFSEAVRVGLIPFLLPGCCKAVLLSALLQIICQKRT